MINPEELMEALVDLFEGWVQPSIQFSTSPLGADKLRKLACQFYALNCHAFEAAAMSPDDLIRCWSERQPKKL